MDSDCLIVPTRERGEPEISGTTLFCPNPTELHRFEKLSQDESRKSIFLYNSRLLQISQREQGNFYICGPAVGAPMAVLSLEKIIALGCRRIVVVGICGALGGGLSVGDLFMPTMAISEEGTSAHYPLERQPSVSSGLFDTVHGIFARRDLEIVTGKIWTTDAPYRETRQKIESYQSAGVQAVDMEFSALVTVANYRDVEVSALMVVSDIVRGAQWVRGFSSKVFKAKCADVCQTLFESCLSGEL